MPIILQSGANYGEDSGKSDFQRALAHRQASMGEGHRPSASPLPKKHSRAKNEMETVDESSSLLYPETIEEGGPPADGQKETDSPEGVKPKKKKTRVGRATKLVKLVYKKLGLKHIIPLLIVVIYCLIGAGIFQFCEYEHDRKLRTDELNHYLQTRQMFEMRLEEIARTGGNNNNLQNEIKEAVDFYQLEVGQSYSNESIWHFWNAMYFAGTIFTTIGYGNIACVTTSGQVMTMVYALFGIPLLLSSLNDLGKWMFRLMHRSLELYDKGMAWARLQWELHRRDWTGSRTPSSIHSDVEYEMMEQGAGKFRKTVSAPADAAVFVNTISPGHNFDKERSSSPALRLNVPEPTASADKSESNTDDLIEDLEEEFDAPPVKIPVIFAATTTVGWIFFCAGLFCIWEKNWSYFTSVYFFFISLSTIGLGDVTPEHTNLMVINFGFVIIGLSLVSMLINVIQQRLEDLYLSLLLMILDEYQREMSRGGDQVGASIGMMQMWGGNTKAKLLMPLMGKDKKAAVMQKFTAEAKAQGIELPPVLTQVDPKSGLPAILSVKSKGDDKEELADNLRTQVKEAIVKAETIQQAAPPIEMPSTPEPEPEPIPSVLMYDGTTQTVELLMEEQSQQTAALELMETCIQTDSYAWLLYDNSCQTEQVYLNDDESQTLIVDYLDQEVQSLSVTSEESCTQTVGVIAQDEELQTHIYEQIEAEVQTDGEGDKELINHKVQTDTVPTEEKEEQTEIETQDTLVQTEPMMTRIRKLIRKSLKGYVRQGVRGSMPDLLYPEELPEPVPDIDVEDEEDSSGSVESLHWDKVDGLHAEKQRKVSDLRAMFGSGKITQPAHPPGKHKTDDRRKSMEPHEKKKTQEKTPALSRSQTTKGKPGVAAIDETKTSGSLSSHSSTGASPFSSKHVSPRESFKKLSPRESFKTTKK